VASEKEILVGGQAVLEGVMMKLPRSWAVTVRRASGEMTSRSGSHVPWTERWPILALPVLRGVAVLFSTLGLGMRSLFFSSDVLARDLEEQEKQGQGGGPGGGAPKPPGPALLGTLLLHSALVAGPEGDEEPERAGSPEPPSHERVDSPDAGGMKWWELALSIAMALGSFLLLFKALPLGVAWGAAHLWEPLGTPFWESAINGLALLVIFVGYLGLMSLIPDIKRVFHYHGAEHKVVWMSEHGEEPTVDNAARHSRLHPRCGTSFLFFVIATSVVVWAVAGGLLGQLGVEMGFLGKLGLRLALFPLIIGLSYELIRLTAKRHDRGVFRALVAPGLWSQRITTKEPDASMLEVSLRSLALAQAAADGRQAPRD
jgi:uncharacterized protein YqhQ